MYIQFDATDQWMNVHVPLKNEKKIYCFFQNEMWKNEVYLYNYVEC